jgi:hypothetical protein
LIDQGSRTAPDASLFHYTTSTTVASKEGSSQVDIGLHYIAANAGNQPTDNDGDGLPDYAEDADGNGAVGTPETSFANSDTDYDGRSDGQEFLLDGTDPLNPADGTPVQLSHWRFDDATWTSVGGGLPVNAVSLSNPSSWSGKSLKVDSPAPANLKYRDVEPDGTANINCRNGTVRFWFRPSWSLAASFGGSGPGHWARLIEMGYPGIATDGWWALSVDPTGDNMVFQSSINSASPTTYFAAPTYWLAGGWHQIVLTYNSTETKLYINSLLTASGPGIQSYPAALARAVYGINIGSNRDGSEQARGQFDELETYN